MVEEGCGKGLTPCVNRVTGSRFPPGQKMMEGCHSHSQETSGAWDK